MGRRLLKILGLLLVIVVGGTEAYGRFVLKLKPGLPENHLAEALSKFAEFDPRTGVRYRINIDQMIDAPSGDFSILFKTNEIGLRDRPMGTHLRQELKFLVFGDEFAEGWGADIDQIFVVQAQNLVNAKTALKPAVRFVVTGKSGYGAAQNYLAAAPLIETLQPKAIVFFYSSLMPHADAQFLRDAKIVDGLATGMKMESAPVRLPHLEDHTPPPAAWLRSLASQSVAARLFAEWQTLHAARAGITVGDPLTDRLAGIRPGARDLKAIHEPSLRHVRALAALAAAHNIQFLLVHLPLPPQVTSDAWAEGRRLFAAPAGVMPSDDAAVVEAFCQEAGLRCLKLHDMLREGASKLQSTRLFQPSELAMTMGGADLVAHWFADEVYRWLGELGARE
jgi:hypothetical protein